MLRTASTLIGLAVVLASCGGGKKPKNAAAQVGWHGQEGWPGACYYPPAWDQMGPGDRKIARQKALEAMMSQWQGERDDGVSFPAERVTNLETVLLGQPELIELVTVENLERCQSAMGAGGETMSWGKWLRDLPDRLTEGQCKYRPLDYQLFDYLDIGRGWQIPASVCQFDKVLVSASSIDEYRIEDKGKWINAAGDRDVSTVGTQLPCNFEGCYAGMLILRFTGDSGVQQIYPVGTELAFEAPEHGKIEVQINDDTWFDNRYRIVGTIEHHTSIEYHGK